MKTKMVWKKIPKGESCGVDKHVTEKRRSEKTLLNDSIPSLLTNHTVDICGYENLECT